MADSFDPAQHFTNLTEEAFEKVKFHLERANYYFDIDDASKAKALEEYVLALQKYVPCAEFKSKITQIKVAIDTQNVAPPQRMLAMRVFSVTCFDLSNILIGISRCLTGQFNQAYVDSKIQKLTGKLSEYERFLEREQLDGLETLRRFVKAKSSGIQEHQSSLASMSSIKDESDPILKVIRKALADISAQDVCPVTLEASGGCFIATAAYLTPHHSDLDTFRDFRDYYLMHNRIGKVLVSVYYSASPSIAQYVLRHPGLRSVIKGQLEKLAVLMREKLNLN